jgi:hypothetical protein
LSEDASRLGIFLDKNSLDSVLTNHGLVSSFRKDLFSEIELGVFVQVLEVYLILIQKLDKKIESRQFPASYLFTNSKTNQKPTTK